MLILTEMQIPEIREVFEMRAAFSTLVTDNYSQGKITLEQRDKLLDFNSKSITADSIAIIRLSEFYTQNQD